MIKPAKDYELQIAIESIWAADDPDNKFLYFNSKGHVIYLINNESKAHEFAILSNNELIGFIRYKISQKRAYDLLLINFSKKNINSFALDGTKIIKDIFDKYNLESLSFETHKDNPLAGKYIWIISIYNGTWEEKDDFFFFNITREQYFNK